VTDGNVGRENIRLMLSEESDRKDCSSHRHTRNRHGGGCG